MQLHSAQHIFSHFASTRFDVGTGRADFSPDGGLVVTSRPLMWEQALLLEDDVNRLVRAAARVTRSVDQAGTVTIDIAAVGTSPCGGTHVTSTAEIELFKITGIDGKVVRYETGEPAKRAATKLANYALESMRIAGVDKPRLLPDAVSELDAQHRRATRQLEQWTDELTVRQIATARRTAARTAAGTAVVTADLSHLDIKTARVLLRKELAADDQVCICLAGRGNILLSSSTDAVSAADLMEQMVERWGIRGGGNPHFAQGGPVPTIVARPLDEVASWLLTPSSNKTTSPKPTTSTTPSAQ